MATVRPKLRFGSFEFASDSGRLSKDGVRVKLATQPAQILAALLDQPGELVPRERLRALLWGDEHSADAEHSINVVVARLREALSDSADEPAFIVTVPRRGYRFIGSVTAVEQAMAPVSSPVSRPKTAAVALAIIGVIGIAAFVGFRQIRAGLEPRARKVRLAVLPFENFGGQEQDYFCDGLTEEMITSLSRARPDRLTLIARTSIMRYKQGRRPIRDIGRELAVDYILEGSVRRDGPRARVTAQLIQVRDESHLWAESYDRELGDLIRVQSDVVRSVEEKVLVKLAPGTRLQAAREVDPRARDEYLRGRYQWNKRNKEAYRKAIAHFEQAIAIDPSYGGAYVGIADAYLLLSGTYQGAADLIQKSRAAARKALEINPQLAEAHASLGLIAMNHDWDWTSSEKEYRRAIEINPNYATAHHWYAELLNVLGRVDEALLEIERAREPDPLSLGIATDTGKILYYGRRYPGAVQWLRKVLDEEPDFGEARLYLVETYASSGRWQEALVEINRFNDATREGVLLDLRAWLLARLGRLEEARQTIAVYERLKDDEGTSATSGWGNIALGNHDKALSTIEVAVERRTTGVTSLKVHPLLDPLRNEPRFTAILRRVGLQ